MIRLKKILSKTKRFVYRYKYPLGFIFITLFTLWLFCLPRQLFKDSTSTVLFDRDGHLLGASIADDGQWRFPHNPKVPEKFKKAIIQFEDRTFESHLGVSLKGLLRATYQNISSGRKVSGGSTITMQVMRMSRKGKPRNIWQKVVETFWATRAEWRYSKDEILALYASNAPMGGNVVGLDAAAWRYFGRAADQLSWAETATLAVLPNAPGLIRPGTNSDLLLQKRNRLLNRLFEVGEIDSMTWQLALLEELPNEPHAIPRIAPHLLDRAVKEGHEGQVIESTIDYTLQSRTNSIVQYHHKHLSENEIYNAAALIMNLETGEVLAYTGNVPDVDAEHGRDVDIITAPRSTGSILKPFLYAAMLQDGLLTPSMVVRDIPTVMSGYSPKNYNLKYDGIVPADEALARSLNVPMVRLLTQFGVAKFHYALNKIGFATIQKSPQHYGLSLILGGAEVNLWDLVSAYGMLGRGLNQYPNYAPNVNAKAHYLLKDSSSNTHSAHPFFDPAVSWYTLQAMKEVKRPDEDTNWELFSTAQKIAWKTGTSFGFRDAWAVGLNSKYVVGVWVGNADGEGRPGLIGREAAAPLLFDLFSMLTSDEWFYAPYDNMEKIDICQKSGYIAGEACEQTQETFVPIPSTRTTSCPYHSFIFLDETESYRVNANCYPIANAHKRSWFQLPPVAEYFYKNHDPNYKDPPEWDPNCNGNSGEQALAILYPKENSDIFIPLNFEEENEHLFFEATHIDENATLYWHLDNEYLGETTGIHQFKCQPLTGEHTLKVVDHSGNSENVTFKVLLSAGTSN